ncbi:type II toxin-antitoxin system RelB/DinJ family antitoxin [Helicobacter saguini]|nr:type II toxin-antitoxin system RelB/DinJ family antitoxin [Helicobacter saguini]MWV63095.1 type II toxin-antitoxin system RelB/DinJ family antitoxin [Helicobacter saguini]MWV68587.1 type II toxin-antitoxin system RelB/DinJ family antitoxin [Helicobacter saguini]MWV71861.1 type II toxin-antitoxin system RelB/DinJ family antitoxin [Helicobacter saguini]
MTTLMQLKVDKELKAKADKLFGELGLDTPTALRMFLSAAVREQRLPLKLSIKKDPFYSDENIAFIKESIRQIEQGKVVEKTIDELENTIEEKAHA